MITKEYLQQELLRRIDGIKPGVITTTDLTIGEMRSILVLVDALEDSEHLADARKTSPNDLEEAADNHIRNVVDTAGHPGWDWTTQDIAEAFIAGAKWQAEQLLKSSPLPEDTVLFNKGVEEGRRLAEEEQADLFTIVALDAAQRAKEQMMKDGLDAVKSGQSNKIEKTIAGVFVDYGMRRQKEQMMKGAVEGYIERDCGGQIILGRENSPAGDEFMLLDGFLFPEIRAGEKYRVRIIIVKEDEV